MPGAGELTKEAVDFATEIATCLRDSGRTASVAESLTSGNLASHLGAAPEASEWFSGGVVAYASHVKFKVLDVPPGPVVTAECAEQMARGVARLTDSDLGLSATGVGGPESEEGHPPGTVFLGLSSPDGVEVSEHHFDGDPAEVIRQTTVEALKMLLAAVRGS